MPVNSYLINGTVYDLDGSTASDGAKVTIYNVTTKEKTSTTTNSSGQFLLDLANLASGYTIGDKIVLTAQIGTGSATRSLSKRKTTAAADNYEWSVGSIVLHEGMEQWGTCYIVQVAHTNSSAGGLYVDFYDRDNDVRIFRIEAAAGTTTNVLTQYPGIKMDGGFIRVFESETAAESKVLMQVR